MKKHIFICQIFQFLFVLISGVILHFLCDWTESAWNGILYTLKTPPIINITTSLLSA